MLAGSLKNKLTRRAAASARIGSSFLLQTQPIKYGCPHPRTETRISDWFAHKQMVPFKFRSWLALYRNHETPYSFGTETKMGFGERTRPACSVWRPAKHISHLYFSQHHATEQSELCTDSLKT
jgi:hypothetical protein